MSHVLYPVVPRFDLRTFRGRFTLGLALFSTVCALTIPSLFFFPACIIYILIGLSRSVLHGFDERLPTRDPLIDVEETVAGTRELEYDSIEPRPQTVRLPEESPNEMGP